MTPSALESSRALLIRLSAALAARNQGELKEALVEGAEVGDVVQVEEAILQSYLFIGYPIALNAFSLWREVTSGDQGEGIPDDWESWSHRGESVCRIVYGGQYEGLRKNVRNLHPDMERWMVVEGYGKVLGRPGLDLATRELCIVALLVVLRTPRQLYSHLRGALNAGANPLEIEATLDLACAVADEPSIAEAREVWEQVKGRVSEGGTVGSFRNP